VNVLIIVCFTISFAIQVWQFQLFFSPYRILFDDNNFMKLRYCWSET